MPLRRGFTWFVFGFAVLPGPRRGRAHAALLALSALAGWRQEPVLPGRLCRFAVRSWPCGSPGRRGARAPHLRGGARRRRVSLRIPPFMFFLGPISTTSRAALRAVEAGSSRMASLGLRFGPGSFDGLRRDRDGLCRLLGAGRDSVPRVPRRQPLSPAPRRSPVLDP